MWAEGDDVLFYMDYFKYTDKDSDTIELTKSDSELFQSTAQLGVVHSVEGSILKVGIPGQPIEILFDVPLRYARKPRIGSYFSEWGGTFGSPVVYFVLLGIIVFL